MLPAPPPPPPPPPPLSLSLPLYPSFLSLVAHIVCLCKTPVAGNHYIFSFKGLVPVSSWDILSIHLLAADP